MKISYNSKSLCILTIFLVSFFVSKCANTPKSQKTPGGQNVLISPSCILLSATLLCYLRNTYCLYVKYFEAKHLSRLPLCIIWPPKFIKDTQREKVLSNKTPSLTKSMNMSIWVVGTSNQLFIRGS